VEAADRGPMPLGPRGVPGAGWLAVAALSWPVVVVLPVVAEEGAGGFGPVVIHKLGLGLGYAQAP
jgi:hypothetical protein